MNWSSALSISALLISTIALVGAMQNMSTRESEKTKLKNELVFNDLTGQKKPEELSGHGSLDMPPAPERQVVAGCLAISPYVPPNCLAIACGAGKVIKIYFADGRVEIPDGVSLPEAAKMFWDAVGVSYTEFKRAIISQYEKEKKIE